MHAQALLRTHRKDEVGGPCVGLDGHIGVEPIDLCLNKRLREGQHGLSPAIGRSAVHTKRCALKRLPRHVARDHTGNGARVEVVQQDTAGGAANDSLRAHHRARRACKANAEPVACGAGERAHKGGVDVRSVDSVVEREARHWRHRACIASAVTRDSKRLAAGGRRLGRQGRRRRLREWRGDLRRWQTRRRRRRRGRWQRWHRGRIGHARWRRRWAAARADPADHVIRQRASGRRALVWVGLAPVPPHGAPAMRVAHHARALVDVRCDTCEHRLDLRVKPIPFFAAPLGQLRLAKALVRKRGRERRRRR